MQGIIHYLVQHVIYNIRCDEEIYKHVFDNHIEALDYAVQVWHDWRDYIGPMA